MYWLALLLIPLAISIMDFFIERVIALVAPSSQTQLHEMIYHDSSSKLGIDLLIPPAKFVQKEIQRGPSSESYGSGYNPDDGVKLSTTPSEEDWSKVSH